MTGGKASGGAEQPREGRAGTVTPKGKVIRDLRKSKAWDIGNLARAADISEGTIANLEGNRACYLATLKRVADALGVPLAQLSDDVPQPRHDTGDGKPRVRIQLSIDIPFEAFDQSGQLTQFISVLQSFVDARRPMDVPSVDHGSTVITVDMDPEDLRRIVAAFIEGDLPTTTLPITHINLMNHANLVEVSQCLREHGIDPAEKVRPVLGPEDQRAYQAKRSRSAQSPPAPPKEEPQQSISEGTDNIGVLAAMVIAGGMAALVGCMVGGPIGLVIGAIAGAMIAKRLAGKKEGV